MSGRARLLAYGCCGLLVALGATGAAIFPGLTGQLLAFILISLGLVFALGFVFLEVGLSEDRERAGEAQRREPERADPVRHPSRLGRRPRLDRMRGSSRRLR